MSSIPGVNEEQIRKAREVDLLSYLKEFNPAALVRQGSGRYVLADHDSFVISNGKWRWNSRGIGGVTALDYLMKVENMGFVQTVELLTGEQATSIAPPSPAAAKPEKERKEFKLP